MLWLKVSVIALVFAFKDMEINKMSRSLLLSGFGNIAKISLSKYHRIELDNPKGYEIDCIVRCLDKITDEDFNDQSIQEFARKNLPKNSLKSLKSFQEALAKKWVILRFDVSKELYEEVFSKHPLGYDAFGPDVDYDEDTVASVKKTHVLFYLEFLNLVLNDFFALPIFFSGTPIEGEAYDAGMPPDVYPSINVQELSKLFKEETDGDKLILKLPKLKYYAGQLEKLLPDQEKRFKYIGEILFFHSTLDWNLQLIMLVSIIELMLTHNPDQRYNAEDSISKQFILKTADVYYQENKKADLRETEKLLRQIYNLRSSIAHGEYSNIEKIMDKFHTEGLNGSDLNDRIREFIRCIIRRYLLDPEYIDFLKRR
ncbi:MAG: HEPN domain-containing protein [bacterium]|nr:HEPN domain-containing protein [bacterium]